MRFVKVRRSPLPAAIDPWWQEGDPLPPIEDELRRLAKLLPERDCPPWALPREVGERIIAARRRADR